MRTAIIDLGTNTCNLLVAEVNSSDFKILHQSKQLVKLGDDKIRENEISREATARTLQSFQIHKKFIKKYNVEKVKVIATSAVRSAGNKIEFLEKISEESGWIVKVISGEKEAELIFKGVLLAIKEFTFGYWGREQRTNSGSPKRNVLERKSPNRNVQSCKSVSDFRSNSTR